MTNQFLFLQIQNNMFLLHDLFHTFDISYTGCPKQKAERSIFVTLISENIAYFDFIR